MVLTALVVLMVGVLTVAAAETETDEEENLQCNMDSDTYLALRTRQIELALEEGTITDDEAELLLMHIQEVALSGEFGQGYRGEGNAECILGEDGQLGLFRNENSGMRNGNGNSGCGNRRGRGNGTGFKGIFSDEGLIED